MVSTGAASGSWYDVMVVGLFARKEKAELLAPPTGLAQQQDREHDR